MTETSRPELPMRSVSLENLRPKSSLRKKLKFNDDTITRSNSSSNRAFDSRRLGEDELLQDLNNILRTKLRMVDTVINGQKFRKSSSRNSEEDFIARTGLEGSAVTVAYDGEDEDDDLDANDELMDDNRSDDEKCRLDENEDEDDEEFANVDEIDGPISGKLKEGSDGKTRDVDYNMPVDDEYQKSLDERAAEIDHTSSFQPISQPKVDWSLKEFYNLRQDLPDWFCESDFSYFAQAKAYFDKRVDDPQRFLNDKEYASKFIAELTQYVSKDTSRVLALAYISMGTFASSDSVDCQLKYIRRNNLLLSSELYQIINAFKKISISCRDDNANLKRQTTLLFYCSTILFFIVNVCIDVRDENPEEVRNIMNIFHELQLLQFLTRYIEHWRWNSRLSMRIRNMINLLFKLLVLQFGDKPVYKRTKCYLCNLHDIKYSDDNSNKKLTISPLHYQAFREDITSRFPDYVTPTSGLPEDVDNSNSLSQFLEIPRSKVRNPANLTLAVPEQHLATPAPSPPGSPNITQMSESLRSRKSFQTNMAYPCLYPSDDEAGDDDLTERLSLWGTRKSDDVVVPLSIQEASNILSENLEIKLSVKQLWHERELFMMTERGWQVDHPTDPYNYSKNSNEEGEEALEIMKRVDSYYEDCLSSLNSLVFVLLQTMESNLSNIDCRTADIPENASVDRLIPRLEIIRAKEISMKSSSGILCLLLKWFKLNHVLKFEHLAVLLNDSRYIHVCTSLLSKYSDLYADKIFNRMASTSSSFWKHCSTFNESYEKFYLEEKGASNDYNIIMLSSFTYMLRILRKIIGTKTERLKELPLSIGILFKRYYRVFNMDIYHPILRIIKELTPFKNKRWKSEHMELISGVFLYERLELIDNWVTGKDISGELSDACGQEIALRALLQFYNFLHYETSMEDLGYSESTNSNLSLLNKEAEYLGI